MMKNRRYSVCIIASLMLLSACTKTVYREIPASEDSAADSSTAPTIGAQNDATGITSVPGNAAASAAATNDSGVATTATPATIPGSTAALPVDNTLSGNQTGLTVPDTNASNDAIANAGLNTAEINATIAAAAGISEDPMLAPEVIGAPGAIVDCNMLLPCRWVSSQQDFTFTVGNVDNTGSLDRLSIQYTVNASHDTELILGNGSTALAPGGDSFNLIQQTLGTGNGITPQAVLAGQNTVGSATYDRTASANTLAGWTFTVVDNGLPRTVGFINLPIGTPNAVAVNCAGVLPCQWESSQKDVTITLVAVGGYTANSRLNVNFNLVSTRSMNVVLDAGAMAISTGGEQFDGRTHGWGSQSGFAEVKTSTVSGVMLPGNVSFFRTANPPSALRTLTLVVYEDTPTQRWNPQFLNLPTQ